MPARAVGAYVDAFHATAFLALALVLADLASPAANAFNALRIDATGVSNAELRQVDRFCTSRQRKIVRCGNSRKLPCDHPHVFSRYFMATYFSDCGFHLLVEVDETNDALVCEWRQAFCHCRESADMPVNIDGICQENRIVPPDHPALAKLFRQRDERLHCFLNCWHARLNVVSVRSDGKLEIERERQAAKLLAMSFQHWPWVLGPEDQAIDDIRCQAYFADLSDIVLVAYQDIAFLKPIEQPVGIECRYVGASAGADDGHSRETGLFLGIVSVWNRLPVLCIHELVDVPL